MIENINKIGIRHGRILGNNNEFDFFSSNNWQKEFELAKNFGYQLIEFSLSSDSYNLHPLNSKNGRSVIRKLINTSGVLINHISLDILMDRPFFTPPYSTNKEDLDLFIKMIDNASDIGIKYIQIPLFNNSSIKSNLDNQLLINLINEILIITSRNNLTLLIETDIPAKKFIIFLNQFFDQLHITYDTGNSNYFGYNIIEEIEILIPLISNIHIKDSTLKNLNVPLGRGDVKFSEIIAFLREHKYIGDFILETPYGGYHNIGADYYIKYINKIRHAYGTT